MVNIHMDWLFYITKLPTFHIHQCPWLMIDEWNERINLGGPSWPKWNQSFNISRTTCGQFQVPLRAGSHSPGFITHQLPNVGETPWSLNRTGRVHILWWSEFWRFLDFPCGVCKVSIRVWYDTMFLMFRTNQWWGSVGKTLCTDAVSRSRRTGNFIFVWK